LRLVADRLADSRGVANQTVTDRKLTHVRTNLDDFTGDVAAQGKRVLGVRYGHSTTVLDYLVERVHCQGYVFDDDLVGLWLCVWRRHYLKGLSGLCELGRFIGGRHWRALSKLCLKECIRKTIGIWRDVQGPQYSIL
jgi:hypothetical protein